MIREHDYRVNVTSTGDKTGDLSGSEDGLPDLGVASPPEFGGPAGVWSPEHLFVASIASCLMTTFRAIADASGLEILSYTDAASGRMILDDDHLYRIESVVLRPRVVIADEDKVDKARRILDKAERVCLISRSVNAHIEMEGSIELQGEHQASS
jgi:organic hydroperoxide reductase OsmC/OhrA